MGTLKVRIPLFVPTFKGDAIIRLKLFTRDLKPLLCINMEVQQRSWLQAIFGGYKKPMLPPPEQLLMISDSYSLSKE